MPAKIHFTVLDLMEMVASYEGGGSFREIADARGVSKNTVRKYLLETGVDPDLSRSMSKQATGRPSPRRGLKVSDESLARMSAAQRRRPKNRPGWPCSPETRARISAAQVGKRLKYTPEQRAAIERLRQVCKRFVRRVLKASGARKTTPTQRLLGYSAHDLRAHLGEVPPGYEVDHIVPIVEFFRRGIFEPAVINALPNLQALPGIENKRKSDKVPANADEIIAACLAVSSFDPRKRRQVLTKQTGGGYSLGLTGDRK